MSWRTGIAVLSFFALVAVIQFPRLAEYVRDLNAPTTRVSVPDPVIASPADLSTPQADSGNPTGVTVTDENLTEDELKLLALDYINEDRKLHGLEPVALGDNAAAQMHANPIPVLPLVGSISTVRGVIRSSCSAASIIALAIRSFTLPQGLYDSSLARMVASPDPSLLI